MGMRRVRLDGRSSRRVPRVGVFAVLVCLGGLAALVAVMVSRQNTAMWVLNRYGAPAQALVSSCDPVERSVGTGSEGPPEQVTVWSCTVAFTVPPAQRVQSRLAFELSERPTVKSTVSVRYDPRDRSVVAVDNESISLFGLVLTQVGLLAATALLGVLSVAATVLLVRSSRLGTPEANLAG